MKKIKTTIALLLLSLSVFSNPNDSIVKDSTNNREKYYYRYKETVDWRNTKKKDLKLDSIKEIHCPYNTDKECIKWWMSQYEKNQLKRKEYLYETILYK